MPWAGPLQRGVDSSQQRRRKSGAKERMLHSHFLLVERKSRCPAPAQTLSRTAPLSQVSRREPAPRLFLVRALSRTPRPVPEPIVFASSTEQPPRRPAASTQG